MYQLRPAICFQHIEERATATHDDLGHLEMMAEQTHGPQKLVALIHE